MNARRKLALALLVATCLAACTAENPTEIVLVVDTDLDPDVIDTLQITVHGPSGAAQDVTVRYEGAPRTLGLVAETAVLGPVDIDVVGSSSADPTGPTITRTVATRFEQNVSRVLHIRLSVDCLGRTCGPGLTCGSLGACVEPQVEPTSLPAYLGTVSVPELCNNADDDADGRADEDFDLDTDPRHCGSCNRGCAPGLLCLDGACEDSPIVQIAAGSAHTCARRSSGGVACWGENKYGELGDGTKTMRTRPVTVLGLTDADSISAGDGFTCAVRRDLSVMCWGSNNCGEIGQPLLESRTDPTTVPGVGGAVDVSCAYCHACARLSSGSVYCWGENMSGQIGNGVTASSPPERPTLVMNMVNARSVRVGANHSCALRSDGSVSCWGANASGQVGDGTATPRPVPTTVIGLDTPMDPTTLATRLAAGRDFSCILTTSGARCWGGNDSGQIGLALGTAWNSMTPTVVAGTVGATEISIGATGCFGCVLGAGGAVSCWGCNDETQLANDSDIDNHVAAPALGVPASSAVAVGRSHACALTTTGEVWCWGGNTYGQLGTGSAVPSARPAPLMEL